MNFHPKVFTPQVHRKEVWKRKLRLRIVSLDGLEREFGSEARQQEEKEQKWVTVHIQSKLDLCSPSLSLHIGGHVHDDPLLVAYRLPVELNQCQVFLFAGHNGGFQSMNRSVNPNPLAIERAYPTFDRSFFLPIYMRKRGACRIAQSIKASVR